MQQTLDRDLWFAERDFHPAAEMPCQRQIRIEGKSPVNVGIAIFNFVSNISERKTRIAECNGIILAQINSPAMSLSRSETQQLLRRWA
jgi:hypothetical protein